MCRLRLIFLAGVVDSIFFFLKFRKKIRWTCKLFFKMEKKQSDFCSYCCWFQNHIHTLSEYWLRKRWKRNLSQWKKEHTTVFLDVRLIKNQKITSFVTHQKSETSQLFNMLHARFLIRNRECSLSSRSESEWKNKNLVRK